MYICDTYTHTTSFVLKSVHLYKSLNLIAWLSIPSLRSSHGSLLVPLIQIGGHDSPAQEKTTRGWIIQTISKSLKCGHASDQDDLTAKWLCRVTNVYPWFGWAPPKQNALEYAKLPFKAKGAQFLVKGSDNNEKLIMDQQNIGGWLRIDEWVWTIWKIHSTRDFFWQRRGWSMKKSWISGRV